MVSYKFFTQLNVVVLGIFIPNRDEAEQVLYLITIGNKDTQHDDIQLSKKFVTDHFPSLFEKP